MTTPSYRGGAGNFTITVPVTFLPFNYIIIVQLFILIGGGCFIVFANFEINDFQHKYMGK